MKKLSTKSTNIFLSIISFLNEEGYAKLDNDKGYMPLCVERIELHNKEQENEIHKISLAHYGKQNGDLMADPEMIFVFQPSNNVIYPIYFKHDYTATEQISVLLDIDGEVIQYNPVMQRNQAQFAEMWLNNISVQQELNF